MTSKLALRIGLLSLATLTLAACGRQTPPAPQGDLREYTGSTLEAQSLSTKAQVFNGLGSPLNLTAPSAASIAAGATSALTVSAGQTISGTYGGGNYTTKTPSTVFGNAYALTYGAGQTLWLPRLGSAPLGTALEQLANLTSKSVQVSYSRATVNGGQPVSVGSMNAYSANRLLVDLKPSAITFFFRDSTTKALIAQGTFTIKPSDSVAIVLYGTTDPKVAIVPGGATTPPPPPANTAPNASFTATPASVETLAPVTLDASATTDAQGDSVSYRWELGDGTVASGVKVSTAYAAAGTYTVKLTTTDSKGASSSTTRTVTVTAPAATTTATLKAFVTDKDGNGLADATVSAGGSSATTNGQGVATLTVPSGRTAVVSVTKAGYLAQTIRTDVAGSATTTNITAALLAAGTTSTLNEDAGGTVTGSLGSVITFPADAFVDSSGAAVTGNVNVQVTPVNVTNTDINAFPGEGQAVNSAGQLGSLISHGMLDVKATGANGQPLQLAPGKTANLEMKLTTNLAAGSTIPMWWFNEKTGLWVEEGQGQVVQKPDGSRVLVGTVSHFTSWNFDYFGTDRTNFRVTLQVIDENGNPRNLLPGEQAYVRAVFTYPDGSVHVKTTYVGADGVDILNAPANTTVKLTGYLNNLTTTTTANTSVTPISLLIRTPYVSNVYLTPATQTTTFSEQGALVTLNGADYANSFKLTYADGNEVYLYNTYGNCVNQTQPCIESTGTPNQYRLHLLNQTATYKLQAVNVYDVTDIPMTTPNVTVNYVADPNYVPALSLTPNPLTLNYGPGGGQLELRGAYGYLPSFTLNGVDVPVCNDIFEPQVRSKQLRTPQQQAALVAQAKAAQTKAVPGPQTAPQAKMTALANETLPCIAFGGNEEVPGLMRAAAIQSTSALTLYMPNANFSGTLTVRAGTASASTTVNVALYDLASKVSTLNLNLTADHVGIVSATDSNVYISWPYNQLMVNQLNAYYSPDSTAVSAKQNVSGSYTYTVHGPDGMIVQGTLNITATPGRFIPPNTSLCAYNSRSVDFSANAEIPFSNRVWTVKAYPYDAGASTDGVSIDQNGVLTVNANFYGGVVVRVTNGDVVDGSDYIETSSYGYCYGID